jgi:diaminopimelate epimerase
VKVHFFKYQATGNDFVLIDNRSGQYAFSIDQIRILCDRKFGIGADGLMLIEKHPTAQFNLQYFNSDGSQSLCGNGSRAAVKMAAALGLVNGKAKFEAYDGLHDAEIQEGGIVRLRMNDVNAVKKLGDDFFIHTGSPHYVRFVSDIRHYPVYETGKELRYSDAFAPGGTNVNFVEILGGNSIFVRTYERVTAAALAASYRGLTSPLQVKTLGGDLQVEFKTSHSDQTAGQTGAFEAVYLIGPAKMVFEGDLEL